MKNNVKDFAQFICRTLLLLISTIALSQETSDTFKVTAEESNKAYEIANRPKMYHVLQKDIEYHALEDGEVTTQQYKVISERMNEYKEAYDTHMNMKNYNAEKREAIKEISSKIDEFLNSKEKKDVTAKYLIYAKELADKYDIGEVILKSNNVNIGDRRISLYEEDTRVNKDNLKLYQKWINTLPILEPEKTWAYQQYIYNFEQLSTVPKTEIGKIPSKNISKRITYFIDNEIEPSELAGTFTKLPENYIFMLYPFFRQKSQGFKIGF